MAIHFTYKPIEQLKRGTYQPRETFDDNALKELADSIKSQGIIEPLIVRECAFNQYEIIAGERRWRAAMLAGLSEIPCLVGHYTDKQAAAVTLIENIQRQDLDVMEEAMGYQRLIKDFQFYQDEVATLIGKSRSHVANHLRLLTLSPDVQAMIRSKTLSNGHARLLVGLPCALQITLATKTHAQGWPVRRLEKEIRDIKNQRAPISSKQTPNDVLRLQRHLSCHLGTPVEISSDSKQGGWLKIKFFDNDTLSGLLEKMGIVYE